MGALMGAAMGAAMGAQMRATMRGVLAVALLLAWLPLQDRDVDVGGHKLRARVAGEQGPTVVLESGLGNGLAVWPHVQPAVATFARVVAYDRAGLADSEAGPLPRTPDRIAKELRALLKGLELEPPFVLVGHSAGGLHVRAFAALYPDEVAALVLVDATHEQVDQRLRALDPERWAKERETLDAFYAGWPGGVEAEWKAVRDFMDAGHLPGASHQSDQGDVPGMQERSVLSGLPDIPTVVLTATKSDANDEWMVRTPAGVQAWVRLQREWVAPLSNSVHVLTDRSGHYIHTETPDLVVAAIREACRVVTQGGRLSGDAMRAIASRKGSESMEDGNTKR